MTQANAFNPAEIQSITEKPGVYCMHDADKQVLYVGKAKNLKKRVASYFRGPAQLSPKTRALVQKIASIQVTATHTETEALLLENNLIKQYLPPFNILLRDDKSYPYIFLSREAYPRVTLHRGAKKQDGRYFGPYPSAAAVRESLNLLQKLFPIRQCENSFFNNRSRPCLQYQIERCTAPCVGLIDEAAYAEEVRHAVLFLEGKNNEVIARLVDRMQHAAEALEYERAAVLRDQITRLRQVQEKQYMDVDNGLDVDLVACVQEEGVGCIQVVSIRGGRNLGSRAYFPKQTQGWEATQIIEAFLPQYYLNRTRDIPAEIIVTPLPDEIEVLTAVIQDQREGPLRIHQSVRGPRARWLDMARENALISLRQRKPTHHRDRLADLAQVLELEEIPARLECFDISHTRGESPQASCVVFDTNGPNNSEYRRFNIRDVQAGDDYAAMRQALIRRYGGEDNTPIENPPDVLIVDGGKGQLTQAREVLEELQLTSVIALGIAKGTTRKAGLETLLLPRGEVHLPADRPALHLLQQIRDEAHRFAITGHRKKRDQSRKISVLEEIGGIGPKRRRQLLAHFGGLQGVQRAGVEDLANIPGISRQLARKIYDAFHGGHPPAA